MFGVLRAPTVRLLGFHSPHSERVVARRRCYLPFFGQLPFRRLDTLSLPAACYAVASGAGGLSLSSLSVSRTTKERHQTLNREIHFFVHKRRTKKFRTNGIILCEMHCTYNKIQRNNNDHDNRYAMNEMMFCTANLKTARVPCDDSGHTISRQEDRRNEELTVAAAGSLFFW